MLSLWVNPDELKIIIDQTYQSILEKIKKYANGQLPNVKRKNVIIVDDGIATGFTAIAAALWAKKHQANKVILASPICSDKKDLLSQYFDEVFCLYTDPYLQAIWQYYEDFHQIEDEEYFSYAEKISHLNNQFLSSN